MPSGALVTRFRRSLALGTLLVLGAWGWIEHRALPPTAYFGGRRFAEKWVRLEQFERAGPADVLVVGASQIDQGFDAQRFGELTGARTFNLGVVGTDTFFQSLLLRLLLDTGRRPNAVLWILFDATLQDSSINRQYLAAPAQTYAAGPGGTLAFELGRHLPQFQRRRVQAWFAELASEMPEPVDAFGRTLLAAARYEPPQEAAAGAAQLAPADASEPADPWVLSQPTESGLAEARAHIEGTLRRLLDEGVRVWLVFTPLEAHVFRRGSLHAWRVLTRSSQGHAEWVGRVARELGIELIDLRFSPGISEDPSLFHDPSHLNGAGSVRLAELLAELHSGRRPVPDEWRGLPSRAHLRAILGHDPPAAPSRIELGTRVRLDAHPELFPSAERTELYASVAIPEAGDYRLVLAGGEGDGPGAGVYARVGAGLFRFLRSTGRRGNRVWTLTAGEHRIELLALDGAIGWEELALEREQ